MGIEYTQIYTYTYTGSGPSPTGYQYFQLGETLQTAGSVFVVKYLSVSSTSGITNSPTFAIQMTSNTSNVGAGPLYVLSSNASDVDANVPIILLNNLSQEAIAGKGNQVILTQNYIGLNVSMVDAGDFSVTISYSLIPASGTGSELVSNFRHLQGSGTSQVPLFNAFVSGKTNILKSALISNFNTTGTSTFQFALQIGSTVYTYLSDEFTLAPGGFCCYSLPVYLPSGSSLALYGNSPSGTTLLTGYTSYTVES